MAHAVFFNRPSKSGVRLAKALDATIIKSFGDLAKYIKANPTASIINWGVGIRSDWDEIYSAGARRIHWIGDPHTISVYVDKANFNRYYSSFIPTSFTVQNFMPTGSNTYVGRKTLQGSGGKGIFFFRKKDSDTMEVYDYDERKYEVIPTADFRQYIKFAKAVQLYVPKTNEYRFFVGSEGILGYIEKRKGKEVNTENAAPDLPMANYLRNHTNGYVFCKQGIEERNPKFSKVIEYVKQNLWPIVVSHQMWLVAFDLGYDKESGKIVVYEGNTAPGLMSDTTLADVVEYMKNTHLRHIFKADEVAAEKKAAVKKMKEMSVSAVSIDVPMNWSANQSATISQILAEIHPSANIAGFETISELEDEPD